MSNNNPIEGPKQSKLSTTKMAEKRTLMAEDRTLLAWVRTSMSFISFGFTLAKVLQSVAENFKTKGMAAEGDHIGLFLIIIGTFPLILAMSQYYRSVKMIKGSKNGILRHPSFILAAFILILSVVLFFNIFFKMQIP